MEKKPPVFVREATGLIREVGAWSSFMAVMALVTGGVPVLWVALMYAAPGANWPVAFLVAYVPSLLMAGLFTIVGISMPRSGEITCSRLEGSTHTWGSSIIGE